VRSFCVVAKQELGVYDAVEHVAKGGERVYCLEAYPGLDIILVMATIQFPSFSCRNAPICAMKSVTSHSRQGRKGLNTPLSKI